MITPEVYPQAARDAGCTASYSVSDRVHISEATHTEDQTWYRLSAAAALGWRFSHFEWTQTNDVSSRSYGGSSNDNPCPQQGTLHASNLYDSTIEWNPVYGFPIEHLSVTYCRAVFVEDPHGDITVTTEADPVAGGTTSPVSETHHYVGNPSTTFTLTATPNVGYVFEKWLHNGSEYSSNAQTTVTLYFSSSAQTKHYVAKFRINDKILHGANGTILHGSGGTILSGG